MGASRHFLMGGVASPKKGPHHEVKSSEKPPHGEKASKMGKTWQKGPQYSQKTFFLFSGGGGRRPTLAAPPPPAGAHACNRLAL